MKIHLKAKKIVVFTLLLFVFANVIQMDNVYAEADTKIDRVEIQVFLREFFTDFLSTLDKDSTKDFSREDFASINGYIVAKLLVFERESNKILSIAIYDVQTHEVAIEDISCHNDTIEVMTYVKYSYLYENDEEGSRCEAGASYRVTLAHTETGYCVQDIDQTHSDILPEIKEVILGSSASEAMDEAAFLNRSEAQREADYAAADAYFEKMIQGTKDMLNVQFPDEVDDEDEIRETEDEAGQLFASIFYHVKQAKNYGYQSGDDIQVYIPTGNRRWYKFCFSVCVGRIWWSGCGYDFESFCCY